MKQNLDQRKRMIRFAASMFVITSVTAMFFMIWIRYYNERVIFPFYYKGHWVITSIYVILLTLFFYVYGGLKFGYLKCSSIILSQMISVVCTNVLAYLQISLLSARLITVLPFLILTIIDFAIIIFWSGFMTWVFSRLFPPRKLFVVFGTYSPEKMLKKIRSRKEKFEIHTVKNIGELTEQDFTAFSQECDAVLIYDLHSEERNKILKYCYARDIRVYATSKLTDIMIRGADNLHMFDTPILLFRNNGLTFEQRLVKRMMDILVSSLILVITAPVMALIAIAIKVYDGGPVMFRQERCTLNNKIFRIHKFRSMVVDAEKDHRPIPATEDDPRITPIGRFLRKTRLDELPQMFDILAGNMSIVGPRPERVEHVEKYTKDISEFEYRLKVKGGLTGYAQIYGKYNTAPYDKLKLDLMYIQNYSLLLDLKLILITVKIMFVKGSTEGFEEDQ